MGILGGLGIGGTAIALTAALWYGTKGGGEANKLTFGWCIFLSLLAGAAFKAAGDPLGFSGLVGETVGVGNALVPGVNVPAVGVVILSALAWKKLSLRAASMLSIFLFFVMAATTGTFGKVSAAITNIALRIAG
ncbi:hypothetical protein ACFY0G_17525 [Streptomyces sp. NPDC001552]|uniref:hypothetical protein n=1 Tax=Streptomyces sp. NPDC001552 TaxID=3364587 RepID=UPI00367DFC21